MQLPSNLNGLKVPCMYATSIIQGGIGIYDMPRYMQYNQKYTLLSAIS